MDTLLLYSTGVLENYWSTAESSEEDFNITEKKNNSTVEQWNYNKVCKQQSHRTVCNNGVTSTEMLHMTENSTYN